MRKTRRIHIFAASAVLVLAILGTTGARASHSAGGGFAIGNGTASCDWSPECQAFKKACNPAAALRSGITSSIVNVRHIAGNTETFRMRGSLPPPPIEPGVLHKGAVQLLDSACVIITGAGIDISPGVHINGASKSLTIVSRAHWMVVTAFAPGARDLTWTLT